MPGRVGATGKRVHRNSRLNEYAFQEAFLLPACQEGHSASWNGVSLQHELFFFDRFGIPMI